MGRVTNVVQTIKHHRRNLQHLAYIARLLLELADGGLLRRLALVDEAGRNLNHHLVERGAVLFLEDHLEAWDPNEAKNQGSGRQGMAGWGVRPTGFFLQDGNDAYAVDVAVLGARPAFRRLPGARDAIGVFVRSPFCRPL